MDIRKLIKSLLFIFLVLSLAVLIYKEFSPKSQSNATDVSATRGDKTSVSRESVPVSKSRTARETATKQKEKAPSQNNSGGILHKKGYRRNFNFSWNLLCIVAYLRDILREGG